MTLINGQTCVVMCGLLVASFCYAAPPPECPDITSPETAQAYMRCIEKRGQEDISEESGLKQVALDQDNTLVITVSMPFTDRNSDVLRKLIQNEGLIDRRSICTDPNLAKVFEYGYGIRHDHLLTTGRLIGSILLNKTECEKLK